MNLRIQKPLYLLLSEKFCVRRGLTDLISTDSAVCLDIWSASRDDDEKKEKSRDKS